MKKVIFSTIFAIILILGLIIVGISSKRAQERDIGAFNSDFEEYRKKKIMYGADVLTIINKAIDNNTTHNIPKNEDGFYIEDNKYTVKVELILLTLNDEGKVEERRHQMETIEKAGLSEFISNFGLTSFECSSIEYNKQKRVNKITIKQLEL